MEMIIYITEMKQFPENCLSCDMTNCTLPLAQRRGEGTVKKAYGVKRHPECPLREIRGEIKI